MNWKSAHILPAAFLAIVALSGASLLFTARNGVESDLLALVGSASGENAGLKAAASAMSSSARILVKAESDDAARSRLESLGVSPELCSPSEMPISSALDAIAPYSRGFLSAKTRRLLEDGDYAAVRDASVARLFSPMPPVLPVNSDPFLLFTDYVMEAAASRGEWVSVNAVLTPQQASAVLSAVRGADDVRCAGGPFHAAVASDNSRNEVNTLSVVSLAFVALFGWMLTRSFRFVLPLVCVLAAASIVATAAIFAAYGRPHLVSFVFGTTLIGLSVDYVYHSLAANRPISRPLTFSFLSTAACFIPLAVSGVGVMNQMALFTISGLATVYAAAMLFLAPRHAVRPAPCLRQGGDGGDPSCVRHPWLRLAAVAAVSILPLLVGHVGVESGLFRDCDSVELSRFYRPDRYLAEGERIAYGMSGGSGFIPSAAEQRRNARLVAKLYEEEGERYCAATGLPKSVLSSAETFSAFDPKGEVEDLFGKWLHETERLLWWSFAFLAAALALLFRREWLDFMIPVVAAYAATDGFLVCMGETANFFTRICFFIFIGLGLDYSVFRRQGVAGRGGNAVLYSFLTSFVGFGLLGFTDFAVTRMMGLTLAFGLAVSYFAAKMCSGFSRSAFAAYAKHKPSRSQIWHEQREQCASGFWMQFMWHSYALFGKTFQKLVFLFAMPVIFLCARSARLSLKRFYLVLSEYAGRRMRPTPWRLFRHILGFAWGLMDKTDANTLKKNLPRMSVRDDDGWRCFSELVNGGKGAFLLCSHLGVIGTLPALPESMRRRQGHGGSGAGSVRIPKVHAFQQMGHDAVFMKVFMRHFDRSALELHAVEDIGVETAVEMQEAIRRGELVIMAGDRVSAGSRSTLRHDFLGKGCLWPKGAFRFAELMECPVFGVTCVRIGWNRYEVHLSRLGMVRHDAGRAKVFGANELLEDYAGFLEAETLAHPEQWYQFYDFFGNG